MAGEGVMRIRLERLADKREQLQREIAQDIRLIEADNRFVSAAEEQRLTRKRDELAQIEEELVPLAEDLERIERSIDVSRHLREDSHQAATGLYRTFAEYARDELIVRFPFIAGASGQDTAVAQELAGARLERAVQNTLSSDVPGLARPDHLAQILDIIDSSRPIVASGRSVPLERGQLTVPSITQRPTVAQQLTEKTEAGTVGMQVSYITLAADTYLGAGDLSWQAYSWSNPDALGLWFELAAEAYARQTETAAGSELGTSAIGTISPVLGTAGTEDFSAWRAAVLAAASSINSATSGRSAPNTLYVSATRFFQLAGLSSTSPLQLSAVGSVNVGSLSGEFSGLKVVGSYGLSGNATIVGDSNALLVGEHPGSPVQLRVVEPSIGGLEVGVIGAFKARVFDADRFVKLNA